MKVRIHLIFIVLVFFIVPPGRAVVPRDNWSSLTSQNYLLLGNVTDDELRAVAVQLERFRDVFTRQFKGAALNSPVPTTVIVFKSDSSFGPYKPLFKGRPADVAGYFQSGYDMNYITLSPSERRQGDPYELIFHESVHLLVENKVRTSPAWFNEGLAEYFSALVFLKDKTDGSKQVMFGKPITRHLQMLRDKKLLPLATLFEINRTSPYYNEREKSGIFYAESWALVHYLTHGRGGQRQAQLARFLELLSRGAPLAQSFQQAFESDYATLEKELQEYVRQDKYRVKLVPYVDPNSFAGEFKTAQLSEAQVLAYLGDLLLHNDRGEDAEKHLTRALALAPDLSSANASLGMLRVRQRNFTAAKEHLQRAIKSDRQSYLAQYYYAYALSREAMDRGQTVTGYPTESAAQMRTALAKAIELAPDFPESYRLLAFVHLATNSKIEEAGELLNHALALSPGRHEFSYLLAQVQLRRKDYAAARATLDQVIENSPNQLLRAQAREMLEIIAITEKYQPKQ